MSRKNTSPEKQMFLTREKKIIILFVIPAIVFAAILCREGLNDQQIAELAEKFNFSKFGAPVNGTIITFLLLLFGLFAFFPLIRLIQNFFSALTGKYFVISLATLAVLGATAALYIPSYTNWFKPDTQQSTSSTQNGQGSGNQQNQSSKDPSSDLRLHLLYITGGIIAVLGLIETNRKNSQDHIRQVHAARRDRYIEAVDKLSSEQAPVRLGGVYALVGLIDEWLDDDNIDEKIRTKEGQIIINNLCTYIRSPFSLAEKREIIESSISPYIYSGNLSEDKAKLREEQDVRRAIFEEKSKRSSTFAKDNKGKIIDITSGPWSGFNFDFSQAPIFYPLNNLIIEQAQFNSAQFYGEANFKNAKFTEEAKFRSAKFTGDADFQSAKFTGDADFLSAEFTQNATFTGTEFSGNAKFWDAEFTEEADFGDAEFTKNAKFRSAKFTGDAHFWSAKFTGDADFEDAEFTQNANFLEATFTGPTSFKHADFKQYPPIFANVYEFAQFSVQVDQKDYALFSVKQGSRSILPGTATLNGKSLKIPHGAVLFDPSSGETSEPAK